MEESKEEREIEELEEPRPRQRRLVTSLWILVFALLLLLLGQSMRRHHFFDGVTYKNRNGGTQP